MTFSEQNLRAELNKSSIPSRMHNGIINWIVYGVRPGHFLTAVLENNLRNAVNRADNENLTLLPIYVQFLYNHAPDACWGSYASVIDWMTYHKKTLEREEEYD